MKTLYFVFWMLLSHTMVGQHFTDLNQSNKGAISSDTLLTAEVQNNESKIDWNNGDRYYVFSSARPTEKGMVLYRNIGYFGNIFSIGLTDFLSVDTGMELARLAIGEAPYYLFAPKLSVKLIDQVHGSLQYNLFPNTVTSASILQASLSFGTEQNNATFSTGYMHIDNFTDNRYFLYSLGLKYSISKKFYAITEFSLSSNENHAVPALFTFHINTSLWQKLHLGLGVTKIADRGLYPTIGVTVALKELY